ncbi:hypothetical protein [Cysteiniphilum sp. JM-1]|uniref:hypothetical protein n=1 Tax=Cysteiniphilum TaxID=2056696 RepID=UPI0012460F56|nr:hypothetical protein [Cysteiniphilum sp. JM-1]
MLGRYSKNLFALVAISFVILLSACGGSGGSGGGGGGSSTASVGTQTVNCPQGSTCAPEQVSMVEAQS